MAFGVFIHRTDSAYNDVPSEQYQFPKKYLSRARQCEGDWIVYLEPSKVKNSKGYFALARVREIVSDPENQNMFFALIEKGSYLDFGDPVQFRNHDEIVEKGLGIAADICVYTNHSVRLEKLENKAGSK